MGWQKLREKTAPFLGAYLILLALWIGIVELVGRKVQALLPIGIVILAPVPIVIILFGVFGLKEGRISLRGREVTGFSAYVQSIFIIVMGILIGVLMIDLIYSMFTGRPLFWCTSGPMCRK